MIQVEVEVALSYLLEAKLSVGALDVIIAPCQMSQALFTHHSVGQVQFRWMCSSSLRVPRTIKASNLGDLPLIVTSREDQFRGTLLDWTSAHQVRMNKPYICNNFTVAGALVASSLGVAFLPMPLYGREVEEGRFDLIDCVPDTPAMGHYVVMPRSSPTLVQTVVQKAAVVCSTFDPLPFAPDGELAAQTVENIVTE
jgi:DNA-binding transcriptional LysR family regulator